jgi:hypothetical protein
VKCHPTTTSTEIKPNESVIPDPDSIDDKLNHPGLSEGHRAALIKIKEAVTLEEKEKAVVSKFLTDCLLMIGLMRKLIELNFYNFRVNINNF